MSEEQPRRFSFLLIGLASIFVIIWGIQNLKFIINPILLALVITITVLPLPGKLTKRGIPGWLSLTLTILAVVGMLVIVVLFVVFSAGKLADEMPTYSASIEQRQAEPGADNGTSTSASDESLTVPSTVVAEINNLLKSQQFNQMTATIIGLIGKSVFQLFMVMLIFAFMLAAAISLPSTSRMGLRADSPAIVRITQLTKDVRRYISLMTVINMLVGLGDTIFLYIIGVDFALLWGVLAWVLGYIPSIGFWVALIPPVFLAYAEFGPQTALIVFLGYVLINGTVQNIIQPRIFGQGLKISPVIVFISLFVWGWLLGGIGAILAVPITLMILGVLESFDSTHWLVVLVRATPEKEPGEQQQAMDRVRSFWRRARPAGYKDENNAAES